MKAETVKFIKTADKASLSQTKAKFLADLEKDPKNEEAQEIVDAINAEFERRVVGEEKSPPVRVKAKTNTSVEGIAFVEGQEGVITEKQFKAVSRHFEKLKVLAGLLVIGAMFAWSNACQAAQTSAGNILQITPLSQTNSALPSVLLDGNTNCSVATAVATNYYIVIPNTAKWGDIYVNLAYKLSGSGTDTSILHLSGSGDGSNYVGLADISLAGAGTAFVAAGTNLVINSLPYVRVDYLTNASARTMSGITVKVTYKPSRFGL